MSSRRSTARRVLALAVAISLAAFSAGSTVQAHDPSSSPGRGNTPPSHGDTQPRGPHATSPSLTTVPGATTSATAASLPIGITLPIKFPNGARGYLLPYGYDLQEYRYRSDGAIHFSLMLGFAGPVDPATHHPAPGNLFYGQNVVIQIQAYDVDYDGQPTPERDEVWLNGAPIGGQSVDGSSYLRGFDSQESTTTFTVPTDRLRFPAAGELLTGGNDFEVRIDELLTGGWAVSVDRVFLMTQPVSDADRPVVLLHGLGGTDGHMESVKNAFVSFGKDPSEILNPVTTDYDSIEKDLSLVETQITDFILANGYQDADFVGHSFGGLIARAYAARHPWAVHSITTLGTPHDGVREVWALCETAKNNMVSVDMNGLVHMDPLWSMVWGECQKGASFVYDLNPDNALTFNTQQAPALTGPRYDLIAGNKDQGYCIKLDQFFGVGIHIEYGGDPNDSCVAVKSAHWDDPADGRTGAERNDRIYPLTHGELIDTNSPDLLDVFCSLYPTRSACRPGGAGTSQAAKASQPLLHHHPDRGIGCTGIREVQRTIDGGGDRGRQSRHDRRRA